MNIQSIEINIITRICIVTFIISLGILFFAAEFNLLLISGLCGILLGILKLWVTGKVYTTILRTKIEFKNKSILIVYGLHILFFVALTGIILFTSTILSKDVILGFGFGVIFVYLMVLLYTIELVFKRSSLK